MSATPPTQTFRLPGFLERVIQDALAEGTTEYWLRRARVFDQAAHRPGIDWPGHATDEQLAAQRASCRAAALACRQRAVVETWPDTTGLELWS